MSPTFADPTRLGVLADLDLLSDAADPELDRLTRLAADIAEAPGAFFTVVHGHGQSFKSRIWPAGMPQVAGVPMGSSLARRIVETGEPLVLEDAPRDPAYADHPAILRFGIVSYVGLPIRDPLGRILGSFGVCDVVPRAWPARTLAALGSVAENVEREMRRRYDRLERTRAERREREHEARHRQLVELSPDGIAISAAGTFRYVNPAMVHLLGYASAAELVGTSALARVHPAERAAVRERLDAVLAGARAPIEEHRLLRRDGSVVEVESVGVPTTYDGAPAVQVVVRDVTARKGTEAGIRRQVLVFETIGDAVLVTDPQGRIVDWNPSAERMFGYTKAEMLGRSPEVFHHPDLGGRLEAAIRDTLAREPRWAGELRFRRKDGTEGIADVVVVNQYDAAGTLIARIGVNRDVTERRHLEAQLRQAQKMEAVGRLAGGIAHDFNNLLTTILANTELVASELPDGPVREDVGTIRHAAERAAGLTRQLLAFSRRQVVQPRLTDLNGVVREAERMLQRALDAGIALAVDLAPSLGGVRADPGQLEQVLMNLVVNARDAMPAGGTVTLRTRDVVVDEALARRHDGLRPGAYVTLAVADTGIGMDPATQARVFEPFFTTKPVGEGTGLGLATVYGIVEQWGGCVAVRTAPGAGTTFTIYLPRQHGAPSPEPRAPAASAPPVGSETILVVEDETTVRNSIRRILAGHGYRVLEARHGADALRVVDDATGPIDLLLTDLVMPEMGGRELIAELRARPAAPRIVAMSGYDQRAAMHGEALPADMPFLEKPFTLEGLLRLVRVSLDADATGPR